MDIGKPLRELDVVPREKPLEAPQPQREPVPKKEPEKVPAGV